MELNAFNMLKSLSHAMNREFDHPSPAT